MPYIIGLVVVVLIGVGFTFFQNRTTDSIKIEPQTNEISTTTESDDGYVVQAVDTGSLDIKASSAASDYNDGTYSKKVSYFTPARDEYTLDVTLTLENDLITNSTVVYSDGAEKDPNPQRFEKTYRAEVIGKDLDSLSLSRVGGASLTTAAFNEALSEIKIEASS